MTWLLYDTGNSFLMTALGGLFLSQWIVLDKGFDDIWYGGAFSIATVIVLILSPVLGAWSDAIKKRMPFITITTLLMFLFGILFVCVPIVVSTKSAVYFVLVLFITLQILYQLSLVFYNALLEQLSDAKHRGKIVGLGDMFGLFGWVASLVIAMPFATGKITLLGPPGRTQAFLPNILLFILISWPMITLFKERKAKTPIQTQLSPKNILGDAVRNLRKLFTTEKNIGTFLLGFCFVSDAILTIQLYFAIILDRLYKIEDSQKIVITILMGVVNTVSAYVGGKLCDIIGAKKVLLVSTGILVVVFAAGFLVPTQFVLWMMPLAAGVGWGGFYAASRTLLVNIAPPQNLAEYFGFYSTFQKFASVIGPSLWGLITYIMRDTFSLKYQVAGLAMVVLMLIGMYLFTKVKYNIRNQSTA